MGCIIPYIQNNLLLQLICSSLYVARAKFLQKVLAQQIVHVKKNGLYTVLQHVNSVAVTAVKTKISQRIWRMISVKKMTKEIFLTFLICLILKSTSMQYFEKWRSLFASIRRKTCQIKFWYRFFRRFWYYPLLTSFSPMLWLYRNHYIDTTNQRTGFYIIATLVSNGSMTSWQW